MLIHRRFFSRSASYLFQIIRLFSLAWAAGLILLSLTLLRQILSATGESLESQLYMNIAISGGLGTSLLILAAMSKHNAWRWGAMILQLLLSIYAFTFVPRLFEAGRSYQTAVVWGCSVFIFIFVVYLVRDGWRSLGDNLVVATMSGLFAVILWQINERLLFGEGGGNSLVSGLPQIAALETLGVLVLIQLLPFYSAKTPVPVATAYKWRGVIGAGLVVFVTIGAAWLAHQVSIRTEHLFDETAFHHWGVFIAPATTVRQGGWLLWDTPSQYGFLLTLLLAVWPTPSTWQALYELQAVTNVLMALLIFGMAWLVQGGLRGLLYASALYIVFALAIPGFMPALEGPQAFPSVAGLRFLWCSSLVFMAVLSNQYHQYPKYVQLFNRIQVIMWVVGVLWSAESAFFCSAIFLPLHIIKHLRPLNFMFNLEEPKQPVGQAARAFFSPFIFFALVIGLITGYYLLKLGDGPDWIRFFDYVFAFSGGFGALPIDPNGGVWAPLMIIAICCASTVYLWQVAHNRKYALQVIAAALLAWGTSSYFVARSHPNNLTNLAPLYCVALLTVQHALARLPARDSFATVLLLSTGSFIVVIAGAFWSNPGAPNYYAQLIRTNKIVNIETKLPKADENLKLAVKQAGILADEPIVLAIHNLMPAIELPAADGNRVVTMPYLWVPASPIDALVPIGADKAIIYITRALDRNIAGGWLITQRNNGANTDDIDPSWLGKQLTKKYRVTKRVDYQNYTLTYWERRVSS